MGNREGHIPPREQQGEEENNGNNANTQQERQEEVAENEAGRQSTVHIMLSRGQPHSFSIHHEPGAPLTLPASLLALSNDGQDSGNDSSSSGDDELDNYTTLQILARLLGGQNLRNRRR